MASRARDGRRRIWRRATFAAFVEGRVRDLDNKEEWSDHRFAELEAEVETEGAETRGVHRLFGSRRRGGLRRERKLSRALVRSKEKLILLQGDPGSGKSVALRFVARRMADKARRSKRLEAVIPLYVNLKGLHAKGRDIDAELIEAYVLETFKEGSDRDVHRFLDEEFRKGKMEGTWFFLFDSFDEIPAVLSSTDVDEAVRAYSDAIVNFIGGMNNCRGVIASRYFRAPPSYGLPNFRIVSLTERRRQELIRKADVRDPAGQLLRDLSTATPDLVALSSNPLFLGLLVEYVRERQELPVGWHDVFEEFVSRRMNTDEQKIQAVFGIDSAELRRLAEELAFTMTATAGLGLSPTRKELTEAYAAMFRPNAARLRVAMNALEWIKLARSETAGSAPDDPTFTFSHRRFQEYFATCVVLNEPERVTPRELLTDASWRETAVTLCHAHQQSTQAIVAEAEALLADGQKGSQDRPGGEFTWQPGVLHVLSLLQSAFAGRTDLLPDSLHRIVVAILEDAERSEIILDHKWVLEVAGTTPEANLAEFLRRGFSAGSDWLREVAYRQVGRLPVIPSDLAAQMRKALVARVASLELQRDWPAVRAQVMRLRPPDPFLNAARLLRVVPLGDLILLVALALAVAFASPLATDEAMMVVALALVLHLCFYPTLNLLLGGSAARKQDVWWRNGLRVLAAEARGMTAIGFLFILHVVPSGSSGVLLVIAWAYATTWAFAATFVSVYRPPRTPLGWPFVHLSCAAMSVPVLRRGIVEVRKALSLSLVLVVVASLALLGLGVYLMLQIPVGVMSGFSYVVLACATLGGLVVIGRFGSRAWADRRRYRSWIAAEPTALDSEQMLELLADLQTGQRAAAVLRTVRQRRLLEDDREANLTVRDLLRMIALTHPEDPGEDEEEVDLSDAHHVWRSQAFSGWACNGAASRLSWTGMSQSGMRDELGQLLEQLELDDAAPVA